MTPDPNFVSLDENLVSISEKFLKGRTSTLPVVDEERTLVGMLSELGFVKILIKKGLSEKVTLEACREDVSMVSALYENATLDQVMKCLASNPCNRAYVVNGPRKRLAGVISPKDVMRYLMGDQSLQSAPNVAQLTRINEDLMERLRVQQAEIDRYHGFVQDSPLLMHSINRDGTITMANRALHNVLGYTYDELVGKTLKDLYPQNMHLVAMESLQSILDKGFHDLVETQLVAKDNSLVKVEVVSSSLLNEEGERAATITVGRPIDGDLVKRTLVQITKNWVIANGSPIAGPVATSEADVTVKKAQ